MTTKGEMPRYGGLTNVHTPGISVKEAGQRIRRLAYSEERLMRLFASRVVLVEQREIKLLLARFQYENAQHAEGLRNRVQELRLSKNKLKRSPDEALTILFDESDYLPDTYAFLTGVVEVLLPALIGAYSEYLETTNDLADYPSVRVIRQNLTETEAHLDLLAQAAQAYSPSANEEAVSAEWSAHLQTYLNAAGGILGTGERLKLQPEYGVENFTMPHDIQRDNSFERVWDFEKPAKDQIEDYMHYMMSIRLSEVNVSEGLAFVLLETEDMPWSFYLDISRHLWDEMRHSIFGEVAIEDSFGDRAALPMRDYEGVYAYQAAPLEQYATLGLEIEGKGMKYPPGKRWEWEFSRDDAQHPLMTTFQDFDWADEVLHVNIARRQLDDWFEGGLKAIASFSEAGKKSRDAIKASKPKIKVIPKQ
jgi:hypothetical protein